MKTYGKWVKWPCGEIPKKWERQEKYELQKRGYDISDFGGLVETFEQKLAEFGGSKYAITTNGCTSALFLSIEYLKWIGVLKEWDVIEIPKRTYYSVPMTLVNCGMRLKFSNMKWEGAYRLGWTRVVDSATRFTKGMYEHNSLYCLSFQYRKRLPIGRGGAILTDDEDAMIWLKKARIDGRNYNVHQWEDSVTTPGWNCYMTHDDAARGILIFDDLTKNKQVFPDYGSWDAYPDMSKNPYFEKFMEK